MRKAVGGTHAMPVQQISVTPVEWGKDKGQETVYTTSGGNTVPPERCMSQASTLSNSFDICRICHCEGEGDAPLIAPCYCSGSLRYVHQACLQQWIKSSDIRACELCKFQFIMYSKIKPIMQWEQLELTALERRRVLCSVLCQLMGLTCVLWSLYVLIDRTLEEINRGLLEWPLWTKLIVVTIGCTGSVTFWYFQAKYYCALCRRWRAFNRVIYVQNAPEKVALDRQPSAPSDQNLHAEGVAAASASLLASGGCCGVETEPSVVDVRRDGSGGIVDMMHQGPATSVVKCVCRGHIFQAPMESSLTGVAHPHPHPLQHATYSDDVSVVWLHELNSLTHSAGGGEGCVGIGGDARDSSSSSDAAMELLPPPAAFVDSSTNTDVAYENEKAAATAVNNGNKSQTASRKGSSCSSSGTRAVSEDSVLVVPDGGDQPITADGKQMSSSYMLGSSLTYGHPNRIGYPYMLSTFHAMIPPNFRGVRSGKESSGSGTSLSSSSDESGTSLMNEQQLEHGGGGGGSVPRPWTVGGSCYVEDSWCPSGPPDHVRGAAGVSGPGAGAGAGAGTGAEAASQPGTHSRSQSPLLATHAATCPSLKSYPKTK